LFTTKLDVTKFELDDVSDDEVLCGDSVNDRLESHFDEDNIIKYGFKEY